MEDIYHEELVLAVQMFGASIIIGTLVGAELSKKIFRKLSRRLIEDFAQQNGFVITHITTGGLCASAIDANTGSLIDLYRTWHPKTWKNQPRHIPSDEWIDWSTKNSDVDQGVLRSSFGKGFSIRLTHKWDRDVSIPTDSANEFRMWDRQLREAQAQRDLKVTTSKKRVDRQDILRQYNTLLNDFTGEMLKSFLNKDGTIQYPERNDMGFQREFVYLLVNEIWPKGGKKTFQGTGSIITGTMSRLFPETGISTFEKWIKEHKDSLNKGVTNKEIQHFQYPDPNRKRIIEIISS